MADELLQHAVTWLAANGTSVGGVLLWVTKPLRDKLEGLDARLAKLEKALGDPRTTLSPDVLSPAELTRAVEDLREWREKEQDESRLALRRDIDKLSKDLRDVQTNMNRLVSDEEFRGFVSVTTSKTDKILATVGWIRGRLGGSRPSDDD
jgi:small-conductance mechanosensitive channel